MSIARVTTIQVGPHKLLKTLRRTWRAKLLAKLLGLPGRVQQPQKWIFIVGCYNSGGTLLMRLLSRHPEISSMASEGQFYSDQLPVPIYMNLTRAWALQPETFIMEAGQLYPVDIERLKRQWIRAARPRGRPVLLEKSPPNAARITWLNEHFPNSYFIGIVRAACPTVEGMCRRAGLDIESASVQWSKSNQVMLEGLARVPRQILIRYEALAENPQKVLSDLCAFIGLTMVDLYHEGEVFRVHGDISAITNMNEQSLSRLSQSDLEEINRITRRVQLRLGYPILGESDAAG